MARDIAYLNELTWGCRASRVLHVAVLFEQITRAGFVNTKAVSENEHIGCTWITAVKS
jgi:hypothetical protein